LRPDLSTGRCYDAKTGRWMQRDLIEFQSGGSNLYSLERNGPTLLVDPDGTDFIDWLWKKLVGGESGYSAHSPYAGAMVAQHANPAGIPSPKPNVIAQTAVDIVFSEKSVARSACFERCFKSHFGLTVGSGLLAGAGLPTIEKRFVTQGMSPGRGASAKTSIASTVYSRWFPCRLPKKIKVWAPTLKHPLAVSGVVGRILGRWIPVVGWALLAYDLIAISVCTDTCVGKELKNPTTGR